MKKSVEKTGNDEVVWKQLSETLKYFHSQKRKHSCTYSTLPPQACSRPSAPPSSPPAPPNPPFKQAGLTSLPFLFFFF